MPYFHNSQECISNSYVYGVLYFYFNVSLHSIHAMQIATDWIITHFSILFAVISIYFLNWLSLHSHPVWRCSYLYQVCDVYMFGHYCSLYILDYIRVISGLTNWNNLWKSILCFSYFVRMCNWSNLLFNKLLSICLIYY